MPATLLHLTYDEDRAGTDDYVKVMLGAGRRPIEETRAAAHRLLRAGDYWAVGEFDTSDKERVWYLAQNGTASPSWSREPPDGVRPLGAGSVFGGFGYRSSMVGDIVVVDGHCHIVAGPTGFLDLGPLPDGATLETLPRPKDDGPRADEPAPGPRV